MVSEEFITTKIVSWLKYNGWTILCYDFPQSGTGYSLRFTVGNSKNKNIIIPDIVARKEGTGVLFENKDRFFVGDFYKIEKLKTTDIYLKSLTLLFDGKLPSIMYYGIAFPNFDQQLEKARLFLKKIDFLVTVTQEGKIFDYYNPNKIIFLS